MVGMKTLDVIKYSAKNLHHRKMRLWLTVLGVVVGIASVVALLAIGQGVNVEVERQLSELGGNLVYIFPLADVSSAFSSGGQLPPSSGKLTENDVERIKRVPDVEVTSRITERRASVLQEQVHHGARGWSRARDLQGPDFNRD